MDDRMAQRMVACGWIAAATAGSSTLLFALTSTYGFNHYNVIDAALLFAMAYGISRRSRICAVLALAYHVLNRAIVFQSREVPPIAMVFTLLFAALYVMGVIGTFVYNARRPAPA
jgi:hypothetical protein